jgi:hypothetical protein
MTTADVELEPLRITCTSNEAKKKLRQLVSMLLTAAA